MEISNRQQIESAQIEMQRAYDVFLIEYAACLEGNKAAGRRARAQLQIIRERALFLRKAISALKNA